MMKRSANMLCYQACLSSLIARNENENPSTDFVTRSALRGLKPRRSLGSLTYSTLKLMRSTCVKSSDTAVLEGAAD